tara:strand:+ start:1324 stop:1440 length:117 start_codon:yes stop_codon:yes gene_type:complete
MDKCECGRVLEFRQEILDGECNECKNMRLGYESLEEGG